MKSYYKTIIALGIGVLYFAIHIYFYNQYPMLWYDSDHYIQHGMKGNLLRYGSSFYPMFIRLVSFQYTLWTVVFLQWITSSYVLYKVIDCFFSDALKFYGILLLVLYATSFPFFGNTIMPDIFLGLGLLCNFFILNKPFEKKNIPIYIIFVFCSIAHNGFIYVFLMLNFFFLGLCLFQSVRNHITLKRTLITIALCFAGLFLVKPIINSMYQKDLRHLRNLNFYCRQILLMDMNRMRQSILKYGCKNDPTSVFCVNNKKETFDRENLKYNNELEPECKKLFFSLMGDEDFREAYKKKKWQNIKTMLVKMKQIHNTGLQEIQNRIYDLFPHDIITTKNSFAYANTNFSQTKKFFSKTQTINTYLINISWFAILITFLLLLFWQKIPWNLEIINRNELIFFYSFILTGILFFLLFYCFFSKATNARYSMRLGWLLVLLATIIICKFTSIKRIKTKKGLSSI